MVVEVFGFGGLEGEMGVSDLFPEGIYGGDKLIRIFGAM